MSFHERFLPGVFFPIFDLHSSGLEPEIVSLTQYKKIIVLVISWSSSNQILSLFARTSIQIPLFHSFTESNFLLILFTSIFQSSFPIERPDLSLFQTLGNWNAILQVYFVFLFIWTELLCIKCLFVLLVGSTR